MDNPASDHAHHDEHQGVIKQYLMVFGALCVLTGASFFTYSSYWPFHDTPAVGWTFMMAVSCTKALLVMLFFMHLKWETSWKYVLTIPASVMALFLLLALIPDIKWRYDTVIGGRTVSQEQLRFLAEPRPDLPSHAAEGDVAPRHEGED